MVYTQVAEIEIISLRIHDVQMFIFN